MVLKQSTTKSAKEHEVFLEDMMNGNGQNRRSLPEGWEWKRIGDVADTTSGGTPSRKYPEYFEGTIPWVKSGELGDGLVSATEEKITENAIKNSSAKIFPAGSVLVALYGATVGKVGILNMDAASNQAVCALFPKNNSFKAKYMFYWLMSQRRDLINKSAGGAQPNISQGIVRSHPFPLPPLPEQERIVNRIEELFSELEAGVASLERVRVGLKRYKASVLKAAVEGRLIPSGWGEASGKARPTPFEISSPDASPILPEGWRWVKLEEIAETIGGATKGRRLEGKSTVTLPYLRVANVQRGRLELEVMKEIEILESEIEKYRLHHGDVVLTEGGDWDKLGRSAVWRNQIPNCIHQNHIFRARVKVFDVLPEWLMYYTNSELGQNYFKDASKQTTNLASINLTQLRACPIPLPPLDVQRRIVAEVERRLSVVGEVESAMEAARIRAGRLRQAVLKAAFEGRLV